MLTFEKAVEWWKNGDDDGDGSYFNLVQALYWHCADFHEGQGSERYAVLSQLSKVYEPGAMERGPRGCKAQDFYDMLAADARGEPIPDPNMWPGDF